MKFFILAAFLFVFVPGAFAQNTQALIQEGIDLANKGEHVRSLEIGNRLYDLQPNTFEAYSIIAYNQLCLGNLPEASRYITAGLQVEPTEYSLYVSKAYYQALRGDTESAKNYFRESIKFYPENLDINLVLDEIRSLGAKRNQPAIFNELATWYSQSWQASKQRYPKTSDFFTEVIFIINDPKKVKALTQQYAEKFNALGWYDVALNVYSHSASLLGRFGYLTDAVEMAQLGYQQYLKNGDRGNYFVTSFLLNQLIESYGAVGNHERVVQHLDEMVTVSGKISIHFYDVRAFTEVANSYFRLGKKEENLKWAILAYELAQKSGFSPGRSTAAKILSIAYLLRRAEGGGPLAVQYAEESVRIAGEYKLTSYMNSALNGLAIVYISIPTEGNREKAIYTLGQLATVQEQEQQYADAAATWNNLGAMFFSLGNFDEAAGYFEKSVSYAQKEIGQLNISAQDKLTFYQANVGAYNFLTACYAHMGKPEETFQAMEKSRSRVLGERIARGGNVTATSINDVQEMLQPDEACLMYDLFSGHEVSILVITKKSSQVIFYKDDSFVGDIKDKYLDRLNKEHNTRSGIEIEQPVDRDLRVTSADFAKVTQLTRKFFEQPGMADNVLTEYLKGYYRFLILPVANRLSGIKKLLISPDDVLNFIPFEALQMHDGKYLVEKFDVRYMHSAGVLKQIQSRKYEANRKPLLAMGGAKFQTMTVEAPPLSTQEDLNALQLEVEQNLQTGKSQRRAYAALFGKGPLNELPGTVEEVSSISKTVPNAESYIGADMSESRIKAMAKNGMLSQYKVLHLATHGFVVNDIPDLSGVAMSIFPTEQNGEDGFLNVNEIAALNLHADLTVLSACQTALGKIYSGEGVTGLTQSLLIAGSNAALVSLWPVNDTSTMLFMSGLYKESTKGKSYAQVSNELKRKFIQGDFGEEFKHPNFWAPFVYYGN